MTYELARQLKDAGFPQGLTEHQYGWIEAHQAFELDNGDMTVGVSAPTLEELIEACGEKFENLTQGTYRGKRQWWVNWEQGGEPEAVGFTPIEAVAKLWLALNGKPE
jgi:hypothetical protein